jgi:hypothetical protein
VSLAANGTAIIEAPNVGGLVQGYAAVTLPGGVFGYGVFRQSAAGRADQEAVVPLSDAGATSNTLTWDDTTLITSVAVVNPSSTATTVAVTLWDENGSPIGTASIPLPPNSKTAATLRTLVPAMVGLRGSAQFSVQAGSVAVLGLRFDGPAFTSIPTAGASVSLLAEREVAQTGLAIGMASTVLQSQFSILFADLGNTTSCSASEGGGSVKSNGGNVVTVYYDANCTKPYIVTSPSTTVMMPSSTGYTVSETASYYGLNGTNIGNLTLNETAVGNGNGGLNLYGLGVFTPASGAKSPVQLGVYCAFGSASTAQCAGGIAQDFPALGMAIGAVTPLTLTVGQAVTDPVNFTGGGSAVTGPLGALTLTNPSPTRLVVVGGAPYASTTASGSAAGFELFPPAPTSWMLTDSAHDEQFRISVNDDTTRDLTMTIIQVSTGNTLATGTLDQSGSGTITYSDGTTAAVTSWTLAD